MTDAQLIDNTIAFVDNVDPAAGENTTKRSRYALFGREGFEDFWHQREFRWTQNSAALSAISSIGETALPADFLEVGRYGSLVDSLGNPFTDTSAMEMKRLQAASSGAIKTFLYSIGGKNDAIMVPRGWAGEILTLFYKMTAPAFSDGGSAMAALPVTYQYRVLIPYMRFRGFEDKGDPRGAFWYTQYQAGMEQALRTEKPGKDTTQYVGGSGLRDMY